MNIRDYRLKIYYSEDQIVNNQFTNGREFMLLSDFSEYIGFYHRYSTGEVFTEAEWNPSKSQRLIRWRNLSEPKKKYYDLKLFHKVGPNNPGIRRKNSNNDDEYFRYTAPVPIKRRLTQKEIDAGKTYRYFIAKRNERDRVFFEIPPDQASSYGKSNEGINQFLYDLVTVPWKVDGPEYDVYDGDLLKIAGVIDTNLRIIERYSQTNRVLAQIVKNPRELTVYEDAPVIKPKVTRVEPISVNNPLTQITSTDVPDFADDPGTHDASAQFGATPYQPKELPTVQINQPPVLPGLEPPMPSDTDYMD